MISATISVQIDDVEIEVVQHARIVTAAQRPEAIPAGVLTECVRRVEQALAERSPR